MLIIYANSLNPHSSGVMEYTFKAQLESSSNHKFVWYVDTASAKHSSACLQ